MTPPKPSPAWLEFLRFWAPVVLVSAIVLGIAWQWVEPAPPAHVRIATGPAGSTYVTYAEEYKEYFARHGVTLDLVPTDGARDNFRRLLAGEVDLALVQGGTEPTDPADRKKVEAVCAVSVEPLFVCYRVLGHGWPEPRTIGDLAGRKLAVGSTSGGTRAVAEPLLKMHGVWDDPRTLFVDISGKESAAKLLRGEVDVSFFAVDVETSYLLDLLKDPSVRMMPLQNAEVYSHKLAYMTPVTLHQGAIDLRTNVPDHDIPTVAVSTSLVARRGTHKAVIQLLTQAAHQAHDGMHAIAPRNSFPSLELNELPVGEDARYFFGQKPGFLQRKLPFWLAQMVDRTLILIVPLLVVLIPMIRLAPSLYRWNVQARIYKWYKRLRLLDQRAMEKDVSPSQRAIDLKEVETLDREVSAVRVPLSYMEQLYQLRLHIAWVKDRLAGTAPERAVVPAGLGS